VPLACDIGTRGKLRQPRGLTLVGGLLVSQFPTLFTTPVVGLYLDKLRRRRDRRPTLERLLEPAE
jgi:multidrug efflux pump